MVLALASWQAYAFFYGDYLVSYFIDCFGCFGLGFAVPGSQPFLPILNLAIGGIPILVFQDYKKFIK